MTNEQFEMLLKVLGQVGNEAYRIAVHQAQVVAISDWIFAGIWLVFLSLSAWTVRKNLKAMTRAASEGKEIPELSIGLALLCSIAGIIFAGLLGMCLYEAIQYSLNPEWAALKLLTGLISK